MVAALLTVVTAIPPPALDAAKVDYARYAAADKVFARENIRYAYVPFADEAERTAHGAAFRFTVCSSSRNSNLDRQNPVEIAPGLYRLDLGALEWDYELWLKAAKRDPYVHHANPLVVRGDWLALELSDGNESPAYYDLLYGRDAPKTADEFLKFWKVDRAVSEEYPLGRIIEGNSGVGVQKVRVMVGHPGAFATWETFDFLKINKANDPLEDPLRKPEADGQEWITAFGKHSARHGTQGVAQAYLLSNAAGKRVEKAPVDLVEDHTRFRGLTEVRNPGSCVTCHVLGLNEPNVNELRRFVEAGGEVYDKDQRRADQLDQFLVGPTVTLKRQNEDYAAFILACNGLTPQANVKAYQSLINSYVSEVTPERAAVELGCSVETLKYSIAYANEQGVKVGARVVSLAHGIAIPRDRWEELARQVAGFVHEYEEAKKP